MVGAGEQLGGAGLGGLVLLLMLFLLLLQVFVMLLGGASGALGLTQGLFGAGKLRGEGGQIGFEFVQTRFALNQVFAAVLTIEHHADAVDLVAFGGEPALAALQIALVGEGVI